MLLERLTCRGLRPSTESWGWTFRSLHPPGSGCTCQTTQGFTSHRNERRDSVWAILVMCRTTKMSAGAPEGVSPFRKRAHFRLFISKCDSICQSKHDPRQRSQRDPQCTNSRAHWHFFLLQSATCPWLTRLWRDCVSKHCGGCWGAWKVAPQRVCAHVQCWLDGFFTLPPFTLTNQNSREKNSELWNSFVTEKQHVCCIWIQINR